MSQAFDYQHVFCKALARIKELRDPNARKQKSFDTEWHSIMQQQVVNIGAADFARPMDTIDMANAISIACIYNILFGLIAERAPYCKILAFTKTDLKTVAHSPFIFVDTQANRLVVVKNIENDIALITKEYVPREISELMQETGISSYALVYLLHEKADQQFVGPNNDLGNTSHGKNVHSLPWLFDTYFGKNEYDCFRDELQNYMIAVNEYLGYSVVRSLNPAALINFQKIIEHELCSFDYDQIMHKTIVSQSERRFWIKDLMECGKLKQQYLNSGTYRVLLGNQDYAESLITAEWLLDSMKKAHAIDLTVIATGYFKAMEQLLFALIRLRNPSFDEDSTLGDYGFYYKDHLDQLLRRDVHYTTRNYVREAIFDYARLRNGYLHKHNIHDPSKISEIRSATYLLMYLVLGCQELSRSDLVSLGTTNDVPHDDFEKLCEYIRFHRDSLFCAEPDGYPEQWFKIIPHSEVPQNVRDSETEPSVYFQVLGATNCGRFSVNDAPRRIWAGKIKVSYQESLELAYEKTVLIFEDGRYVGQPLATEEGFSY